MIKASSDDLRRLLCGIYIENGAGSKAKRASPRFYGRKAKFIVINSEKNSNAKQRVSLLSAFWCEIVKKSIQNLITEKKVLSFYVGTQGNFDSLVYRSLCFLRTGFPQIRVYRVLAYLPKGNDTILDSILPEGIEITHPRYAISWRNRWMIDRSDYVIAYVAHSFGVAARFICEAERKGV